MDEIPNNQKTIYVVQYKLGFVVDYLVSGWAQEVRDQLVSGA